MTTTTIIKEVLHTALHKKPVVEDPSRHFTTQAVCKTFNSDPTEDSGIADDTLSSLEELLRRPSQKIPPKDRSSGDRRASLYNGL